LSLLSHCFCILFFINGCFPDGLQGNEKQEVVSYSGLTEIDPTKNHFILVGDTQSTSLFEFWRERNDRERKLILNEIARREPAFVVHLGDLTTRGSSKRHWKQFDELHKGFHQRKIPYFPILGNHDLFGSDSKALNYYFEHFPHLGKSRWYSFVWKNVALILVDSNLSSLTEAERSEQANWYLGELERFDKNERIHHVIVCCHEPPFTNNRVVQPNKEVKVCFADPFLRYGKTRFFFSGHSHSYERFQIGHKIFIVSGGGGGPRHKVFTDSKKIRYIDLFPGPELRFFHFCEIKQHNTALIFRVIRLEPDGFFTVADPIEISS